MTAGAFQAREVGALGSLTGYCPHSLIYAAAVEPSLRHADTPDPLDTLRDSYEVRTALRPHAADKRIAICGTRVFGDPAVVTTEYASGERRARWSGVVLCNRAGCSVCGALRARRFGERVRRLLGAGGLWQHVIMTVPHGPCDQWSQTYDRLLEGLRDLTRGLAGRLMSDVLEATVRATETTWSARNGWHVHFHVLWRIKRPLLTAEKEVIRDQWCSRTGADLEHGLRFGAAFDCTYADQQGAAARYISKLALELAGAGKVSHSEHWSLGEVYRRAAQGHKRYIGLVREYQRSTKGRRIYQLDRRAKRMHDEAPELPELRVVAEWRTEVDREEFSGLSRAERYGRERLAVYLPLEVAQRTRGDPAASVCAAIDDLLRAFDGDSARARAVSSDRLGSTGQG